MGDLEITHDILTAGYDFEACRQRIARFFEKTMLLHYDAVIISENEAVSGADNDFPARIAAGLAANRQVVDELLAGLNEEGFARIADLRDMEKGYLSKILHTIAHLQDGFIGIDSRFYNIEEDSHHVSKDLQRKITEAPADYWILRVRGRIDTSSDDPFDALRTFEGSGHGN